VAMNKLFMKPYRLSEKIILIKIIKARIPVGEK
jgi:hypothetical protein